MIILHSRSFLLSMYICILATATQRIVAMIFRVSVPEKKQFWTPTKKNRDVRHMLCNIAKDPFYGVAFLAAWLTVATYTTFKTQVYGLAPPPTTNSYSKYPHI